MLSKTGRPAEAKPVLESYVADAGGDSAGSAGQYMLASTLDDLGDTQGAIDGYARYIAAGGVLSDYARVERAKLLARLGRVPEAEAAGQEVLASGLMPSFKASFMFSMARAFEQGGADQSALAWYDRAKDGGDVASALARTGAIKQRLGDPAWVADYTAAVEGYPDSGVAKDLLDELDDGERARARVYARAGALSGVAGRARAPGAGGGDRRQRPCRRGDVLHRRDR